jgi:hypothetical protein
MKEVKKIAAVNPIILVIYSIIIRILVSTGHNDGKLVGVLALSAVVNILHVFVNLVVMIVYYAKKNNSMGKAWLLSAGILLLVGFSTCLGNAML